MTLPIVLDTFQKNQREDLRIALDEYLGTRLIDLRVCMELSKTSGVLTPTSKGVSVAVDKLPRIIAALQAAEAKARELGWMAEDEE